MKKISAGVGKALKAVYAGVTATLAGVGVALVGAHTLGAVSDAQWITIAGFGLGAFGAVYGVSNTGGAATSTTTTAPPAAK